MEKEKGQLFSITLDEWTSIRSKRYQNINIHSRTKLLEFGIDFKTYIVCVTTDGCPMMVKLGHIIGPLQQLCYAHGLHLAVMDAFTVTGLTKSPPYFALTCAASPTHHLEEGLDFWASYC
ncbi:hypothetical protein LAZ67_1001339 [Cordylochernes scorpioides]|uniref:Uncharacterized protein n=1 Tax=Cordylochernes scorpioides TaxID=51811 RepID=A0ABY6JW51_9ARAC|nr:hypothetical protein LAZ67_1001339 [Cordylochernes scorpioides]